MAAPLVYAFTVILGARLNSQYSHLRDTVSSLASPGSPNLALVNSLFTLYNLLLIGFGVGWWAESANRRSRTAALLIAAIGLLGALIFFFPQDPMGAPMTASGWTHIALVAAITLLTVSAMVIQGRAEKQLGQSRRAAYSFATIAILLATCGFSAYGVADGWAIGGLLERITVGSLISWIFVQALCAATPGAPRPARGG
jgi:hypothetical membrane protein